MKITHVVALVAITLLFGGASGCNDIPTSDQKMNSAQEQLANEAVMEVGMPAIVNFQEKRMMKSIIESRDRSIATTTYVMSEMTGQLFKMCDSVGYGLPYATQYTNPMKVITQGAPGVATIPQADPNGLFSPSSSEGTWVLCLDPSDKKDKVVYSEPRVIVSPFPITLTPVPFAAASK